VALADYRYIHKGRKEGEDREMCTAITLTKGADGWRLAATRSKLQAASG
jgi:hypothetical protein